MDRVTLKQMIDAAKRGVHEGRMDIVEAALVRMERTVDRMEVPALDKLEEAADIANAAKTFPSDQQIADDIAAKVKAIDEALAAADVEPEKDIAAGTSVEPDPPFDDAPEPMGDGVADAEGV